MRGIYTPVTKIRRQVFTEIAKLAYSEKSDHDFDEIPYTIIPGEIPQYRESVFMERAIVGERLRLAMGMPIRRVDEHSVISKGLHNYRCDEIKLEDPLVNVISFACAACPPNSYMVTDNCRNCLAHPCTSVCPVKAVSIVHGRSHIDKDKCVRCGRCAEVCPYNAITNYKRPCAAACGVDAIESDSLGRAKINHDVCVACGMCIVSCPFAAIADKSELYQIITAIKNKKKVCAAIAPSFISQFGPLATPEKVFEAIKALGFHEVYEVAIGADAGAVEEAHHYVNHVANGKQPFLGTSCCPSWAAMAKKNFPEYAACISESSTPMVATGKLIKKENEDAIVVFIGPCISKKLEASRKEVRPYIDFVITFEELMGMMVAKGIEFDDYDADQKVNQASKAGRGYAVAGGVCEAIAGCVKEFYPEVEMKIDRAEGLSNCKKMMMIAKAGKRNGYLLEGMACPGGCVGGPGTLTPPAKATVAVKKFSTSSEMQSPIQNDLIKGLEE